MCSALRNVLVAFPSFKLKIASNMSDQVNRKGVTCSLLEELLYKEYALSKHCFNSAFNGLINYSEMRLKTPLKLSSKAFNFSRFIESSFFGILGTFLFSFLMSFYSIKFIFSILSLFFPSVV